MSTRALLKYPTTNVKTGPIAALTLSKQTCPNECPLKGGGGCYAERSMMNFVWNKVTDGRLGKEWPDIVQQIAQLPPGVPLRVGQAGDLPGENSLIDGRELLELVVAAGRRPVLAYTHKPVLGVGNAAKHNRRVLRRAIKAGFAVNLSGNNGPHADLLADLDLAPVTVILPHDYGRRYDKSDWTETMVDYNNRIEGLEKERVMLQTPRRRDIVVCPAMYTDTTCAKCGICAHKRHGKIVGFPTHGAGRKRAEVSCDVHALEAA